MKKKVLALLTVLVMVLSIVAVPNVSANADEAAGGTVQYMNHWWSDPTKIVSYAADGSTIQAVEDIYYPDGGFPWYKAIVMDMDNNGMYVVKEIVPADGTNDKGSMELTEGRVVIMYHDTAADTASLAFYNSLQVGDKLFASTSWENISGCSVVPVFTKAATKGALNVVNGFGRMAEVDGATAALDICVVATNDATQTVASVTQGAINWYYSMVLEKDATKGTWVVKVVDLLPDGTCACDNETLGENKLLVAIHDGVEDKESAGFFFGTVKEGQEYYLIGEIPAAEFSQAGTALTGVYLSVEKPADPEPTPNPEKPGDNITTTGDFSTMGTTTLIMVSIALVSVALVLKKRNNVA